MYSDEEYTSKSLKEELKEIIISNIQYNFGEKIPTIILKKLMLKDHTYLNYANRDNINFFEVLNFAYKEELEKLGKSSFTENEANLLKKYLDHNATLFNTLNIEILNQDIINSVGEDNLELIVRYPKLEKLIVDLSKHKEVLSVFNLTFHHLKEHYKFQVSLIEKIIRKLNYRLKNNGYKQESDMFIKLVDEKINDKNYEFTDEEKNIISYIILSKTRNKEDIFSNYDEIKNYLNKYIKENDEIFFKNPIYDNFIQRFFGSIVYLKFKEFNDLEKIKEKYKEVDENCSIELQLEKKSIQILENLNKIKDVSIKYNENKDYYIDLYKKYKKLGLEITTDDLFSNLILEKYLRSIYTKALISKITEDKKEMKEYKTLSGKKYYIKELDEDFGRVVTVMEAYSKGSNEKNFYNKWNTRKLSDNHALCYSYINQSNPGVANYKKSKIIVAINDFDNESLIEMSSEDMKSTTFVPGTISFGAKYYLPDNLANNTRNAYSELIIELQDIKKETYQKIQPSSVICFENVDEASIKASIELSEKLGKIVPIELIDRRKLAIKEMAKIKKDYDAFINEGKKDISLVKNIIIRFHNVRNAHQTSTLKEYILGEDAKNKVIDSNALFSKDKINFILKDIYKFMEQENFSKSEVKDINNLIKKEKFYETNAINEDIEKLFINLEESKENNLEKTIR
jgi:hypothetical protein